MIGKRDLGLQLPVQRDDQTLPPTNGRHGASAHSDRIDHQRPEAQG
ncbi:hypothetical protein [Rhodothermus marinus]|nr:hypothetical protein [Rhodothermus marinus]